MERPGFRLKARKVHLTYKTHFDHQAFIDIITQKVATRLFQGAPLCVVAYSIVSELSDAEQPYKHVHAAFAFSGQLETTDPRFFDIPDIRPEAERNEEAADVKASESYRLGLIHPNIQKVTSEAHWKNVVKYHRKTGVPVTTFNITAPGLTVDDLKTYKTAAEVVRAIEGRQVELTKAGPLLTAWRALRDEPPPPPTLEEKTQLIAQRLATLRPWQRDFYTEFFVRRRRDDRTITWFVDQAGGAGKSTLIQFITEVTDSVTLTATRMEDAAYVLGQYVDEHKGDSPDCIFFNLDRTTGGYASIYTILEAFKDRTFTSPKYASRNVTFRRSPLVVVMANTFPDVDRLSKDRWDIRVFGFDGQDIRHRILGESAMLLHNLDREETKDAAVGQEVFEIDGFPQLVEAIEYQNALLSSYKVGTIIDEKRPITALERQVGIQLTKFEQNRRPQNRLQTVVTALERMTHLDGEPRRPLTPEEARTGFTHKIEVHIRPMSEAEKEAYIAIVTEKEAQRLAERRAWAQAQRHPPQADPL